MYVGTAKSEVARRLGNLVEGSFFERLLTKYTTPEELFGPLSLSALERDVYVRNTDGYLPTATVAFLDEIFKANSAILNSLLTVLNERKFDNGNQVTYSLTHSLTHSLTWNGNQVTYSLTHSLTWNGNQVTYSLTHSLTYMEWKPGNSLTHSLTWNGNQVNLPLALTHSPTILR